jgi:hypothetical protein
MLIMVTNAIVAAASPYLPWCSTAANLLFRVCLITSRLLLTSWSLLGRSAYIVLRLFSRVYLLPKMNCSPSDGLLHLLLETAFTGGPIV